MQLLDREWLFHVHVGTILHTFLLSYVAILGSEQYDRYVGEVHVFLDASTQFDTIHAWHHHIAYDDVDVIVFHDFESFHTIMSFLDLIPLL